MERVVTLPIQILVSVCLLLVDLELGRSIFPSDDVHIQDWQVLLSLFLFLMCHSALNAEVSTVQVVMNSFALFSLMISTTSSVYRNQVEGRLII